MLLFCPTMYYVCIHFLSINFVICVVFCEYMYSFRHIPLVYLSVFFFLYKREVENISDNDVRSLKKDDYTHRFVCHVVGFYLYSTYVSRYLNHSQKLISTCNCILISIKFK